MKTYASERNQDESLSEFAAGSDAVAWRDYERQKMCAGTVLMQLGGILFDEHLYRHQSSTGCPYHSDYR